MTRWTMLAIALAVVACNEGRREQLPREASDTAAGVDTTLRADPPAPETGAAGAAETGGRGAAETKRATAADTSRTPTGADPGRTGGPTGAEAMGGIRATTPRHDLSPDQVKRLQTALKDAGCHAGTADGEMGPRTRQAIACGLKKNNLGSNDLEGLYRSLGLDF